MFAAQRLQMIREIIYDLEIVDIPSLSEKLSVSEVTIRRDLDKLEAEGFIKKTYGGAILNKDYKSTRDISLKSSDSVVNEEDIKMIAEIAVQMIQGDEAIFLGGGPISRYIASMISDKKRLLVVTNDIFVAAAICSNPEVKVTVTGGDLLPSSGILCGSRAVATIGEIYVSKAFIDIKAVDMKFGYSMESFDEVSSIREIIKNSKEVIAMAEHYRFDQISFVKLGDMDLFKSVISNKEVMESYKKYYYDNCIKLFTTYDVT